MREADLKLEIGHTSSTVLINRRIVLLATSHISASKAAAGRRRCRPIIAGTVFLCLDHVDLRLRSEILESFDHAGEFVVLGYRGVDDCYGDGAGIDVG